MGLRLAHEKLTVVGHRVDSVAYLAKGQRTSVVGVVLFVPHAGTVALGVIAKPLFCGTLHRVAHEQMLAMLGVEQLGEPFEVIGAKRLFQRAGHATLPVRPICASSWYVLRLRFGPQIFKGCQDDGRFTFRQEF